MDVLSPLEDDVALGYAPVEAIDITDEAADTLSPSELRAKYLADSASFPWDFIPAPVPEAPMVGGWIDPPSKDYHPCVLPSFTLQDAGRQWRCEECGAVWSLTRNGQTSSGTQDWSTNPYLSIQEMPPPPTPMDLGHTSGCSLTLAKGMCDCPMNPATRGRKAQ